MLWFSTLRRRFIAGIFIQLLLKTAPEFCPGNRSRGPFYFSYSDRAGTGTLALYPRATKRPQLVNPNPIRLSETRENACQVVPRRWSVHLTSLAPLHSAPNFSKSFLSFDISVCCAFSREAGAKTTCRLSRGSLSARFTR